MCRAQFSLQVVVKKKEYLWERPENCQVILCSKDRKFKCAHRKLPPTKDVCLKDVPRERITNADLSCPSNWLQKV